MVPVIPQQNLALAVKSPLFGAAWMVKVSKEHKDVTMGLQHHKMELKIGDSTVDFALPSLYVKEIAVKKWRQDRGAASKDKDKEKNKNPNDLVLPLCRLVTDDEAMVLEEKGEAKKQKDMLKKKKAEALEQEEMGTERLAEEASASLFKHLLK